ncbi:MAG: NAD(P)-binding domain-containing protein [Chthoniobacter sp.]
MEPTADIAVIGLAVMGQNLIMNMNDHGFTVVAYNRTTAKVDEFLANEAKGSKVIGAHSIEDMVKNLKRPRRVMLMVKAGKPVDEFIEHLLPFLEPGDIIIDGGNSLYEDTSRRVKYVESKGLLYIGTGVSGGEEGARNGPSIMPGGSPRRVAAREGHFPGHRRQGGRRHSVLRLGGRRRRRPLREDGAQRHRIRATCSSSARRIN